MAQKTLEMTMEELGVSHRHVRCTMRHWHRARVHLPRAPLSKVLAFCMNKHILIVVLAAFMPGCVFITKPHQDSGFAKAESLSQFEGCYENCSDTSDGSASICLSRVIWPKLFDSENRPDEIHVKVKNESELTATAYKLGSEVEKSLFKEGEQFTFSRGRIKLKRESVFSNPFFGRHPEPGNVFFGFATNKIKLGIDSEGEGRVRESTFFAGTGFLIIPLVGYGTDISKIKRKGASCNESKQRPANEPL